MVKFTQIISFEFKITTSNDIITKLTEGVKKMYLEELCGDEKDQRCFLYHDFGRCSQRGVKCVVNRSYGD